MPRDPRQGKFPWLWPWSVRQAPIERVGGLMTDALKLPKDRIVRERAAEAVNDVLERLTKAKASRRRPPESKLVPEAWAQRLVERSRGPTARRVTAIAAAWRQVVPAMFEAHVSFDSLRGGTLVVLVDSSPHLYELRQLLAAGGEAQICAACKAVELAKIVLKPGREQPRMDADEHGSEDKP